MSFLYFPLFGGISKVHCHIQLNSLIFTGLTSNNNYQGCYSRSILYSRCSNPKICVYNFMLSCWRFQTLLQVAYSLSRDSGALPREYKATRSNVRNSCCSRRKLLFSLMCTELMMRLSRIWPRLITPSSICLILHILRKLNSFIALFIQNNS